MKLQENEKIVKVLKNHYFTNIILWFLTLCFLIILWGIYFFLSDYKYIYFILVVLSQIFLVFFYYLFLNFELWIIIITNLRVISVQKINILENKYIDAELSQIKEVKAKTKWIFANYFWFWELILDLNDKKIFLKYLENPLIQAKELLEILKKTK